MAYEVGFKPAAARQLRRLPDSVQEQILPVIAALAEQPRPTGVVKMAGDEDLYRVRSGNYRIVYEVLDRALLVVVVKV